MSAQAVALQVDSPESHEAVAEAERLREAAYLHTLEQGATCWNLDDPDLGGWGGHPVEDDGPVQVWLGDPSCDETYMN